MKKSTKSVSFVISSVTIIFISICVVVTASFLFLIRTASGIPEKGELFEVNSGEGARILASRLEEEGLIRSSIAFRLIAKVSKVEGRLKAGVYRIEPGMDTLKILALLVSGKQDLVRLTVPEGATLAHIAELIESEEIAKSEEFIALAQNPAFVAELGIEGNSLEGYLFPDTYFFPHGLAVEEIARLMYTNFKSRTKIIAEAASLSPKDLRNKIILASIIEREYRISDEAPLMASVFYNRLKIGMALQSCATVVYVITEKLHKPHPEVLYEKDIQINDPYNTYLNRGLPPGPISNPGITAIRSVFYPATTKYLYFRLIDNNTGRHHFSESLEEHIDAGAHYVKGIGGK